MDVIARRVTAAVEADLVVAVYNPGSASRDHQVADLRQLLSGDSRPGSCRVGGPRCRRSQPGADGDHGRRPGPESTVDMRTLLIIGSSTTVVAERPGGRLRVHPRRYEV